VRPPQAWLDALAGCGDAASLRSAIRGLCAAYGKVTSIDVMTVAEPRKRQALCFLRLESETQEARLIAGAGALRFGSDVLVIVDLPIPAWRPERAAHAARP
jgi:hypothetical protein